MNITALELLSLAAEKEFQSRDKAITFQGHELTPDEAASPKGILPMIYYRLNAVASMTDFGEINNDFAIEPLAPANDDDHENMTLTGYALVQKKTDSEIDKDIHALMIIDVIREIERLSLSLGYDSIEVSLLADAYTPPFIEKMELFSAEHYDVAITPHVQ